MFFDSEKRMRKFLFVFVLIFMTLTGAVKAQEDAHFSHYMFNDLYFNPGYSGLEGVSRATLIHRSQWLGYQGTIDKGGAPSSQVLTFSHPLKLFGSYIQNSGAGLVVMNDQLGPWRVLNVKGSFSYLTKLKNGGVLGAGVRVGIFNQGINGSLLREIDENDAVVDALASGQSNQLKPDFDLGFYYQTPKYYAGLSVAHLSSSEFSFGSTAIASKLARHLYINGGYHFQLGQNIQVTPSTLIYSDFSETTVNYGAIADVSRHKYWGGLTLRQSIVNKPEGQNGKKLSNDDLILMAGLSFMQNNALRLGYAFDLVTSGVSAKQSTSHEIMVSYVVPLDGANKETEIRTPRYRKVQ